jgi:hypothetical protein
MPESTSTRSICALLEKQARLRPQAPAVSEIRDGEPISSSGATHARDMSGSRSTAAYPRQAR